MGKSSQLVQQSLKLGDVAQAVLASVKCNVLLMQHGATIERPVAVLFDGSEPSQRALQLAIQLAHGDHDQLIVMYPATTMDRQQALQQQVATLTQPHDIEAGQIWLTSNTFEAVLQAVAKCHGRVLVVEAGNELLNPDAMKTLIQQSQTPVIVIR